MAITQQELEQVKAHIAEHGDADVNVYNDAEVELDWANRAGKYCETYYDGMLVKIPHNKIRFTPVDDHIYTAFRKAFPSLPVKVLNEADFKSPESRKLWQPVLMIFQEAVARFNMHTLIKVDCGAEVGPENCWVVPRVQFYMVELARLREGVYEH